LPDRCSAESGLGLCAEK